MAPESKPGPRPLREKCRRVKHDKQFSAWKVLVGPTDWQDHAAGKPGVARYRAHNLPQDYFGPGVYELGLVRGSLAESQRRLKKRDVLVVYVGQAENIRQRIQQYGKDGSHLGGPRSHGNPKAHPPGGGRASEDSDVHGPSSYGIFGHAFLLGYAVSYRWSMVASKEEAKAAESALLASFDYCWNVMLNGARRVDAIPEAPSEWAAMTKRVVAPLRFVLAPLRPASLAAELKALGPAVPTLCKPSQSTGLPNKEVRPSSHAGREDGSRSPLPTRRAAKLAAGQEAAAKLVFGEEAAAGIRACGGRDSAGPGVMRCSAPLEDGRPCQAVPVKGRRRCAEHKGMRVALA